MKHINYQLGIGLVTYSVVIHIAKQTLDWILKENENVVVSTPPGDAQL